MSRILTLFLLLLSPVAAYPAPLALQDAINHAIEYSPDIKSLDEQIKSAEAQKRQALAPSDPSVSVSYNDTNSLNTPGSAASKAYAITQP